MTGLDWLKAAEAKLREAQAECGDFRFHAEQIFAVALQLTPTQTLLKQTDALSVPEIEALNGILNRRVAGEPLQYIEGKAGFWRSEFHVGPGVLIPRPETELLVDACLKLPGSLRVAELGAGTGNIGISVLLERDWEWHAFEVNPQSVPYVQKNLGLLASGHRYHLHEGDFFALAGAGAPYDLLVSNPPYIDSGSLATLSKEVRQEPVLALDGGATGLSVVEALVTWGMKYLTPQGKMFLEIGSDQSSRIGAWLERKSLPYQIVSDLSGKARMLSLNLVT